MASTEIEFQPTNQRRKGLSGKWDSTKTYIWNSNTKQFMGRTGGSWGKIGLFYLIFYSCLAAFFAIMWVCFFATVSENSPTQTAMSSLIKGNPGMGFRPRPEVEKTLIHFEQGHAETYAPLVADLELYLAQYEEETEGERDCSDGRPDDFDPVTEHCKFNVTEELGDQCTASKHFGYFEGQPCVLLRLNKVFDWEPEPYENGTSHELDTDDPEIKEAYGATVLESDGQHIMITCQGENREDRDFLGDVDIYPKGGIPIKYFPFSKQPGYKPPLVFAHFTNPKPGMLLQVWCKAWAKNIKHHKKDKAGSAHFELLID